MYPIFEVFLVSPPIYISSHVTQDFVFLFIVLKILVDDGHGMVNDGRGRRREGGNELPWIVFFSLAEFLDWRCSAHRQPNMADASPFRAGLDHR
jgi:hypothetical protein